ncbi:MAG TPA: YdgA family protein [Woeseiaceae bacterium]|nr:YdgA family protein [Woeseiaceae bacterium]
MRKSIVALLVIAAIVVLVSPGIIGRIAEESVENNLQWAADENQGIVVTSERFDRGWFSSQGRHRVEIHEPGIRDALATLAGRDPADGDPTLIIDTRIDHGLIAVTSVGRAEGSLAPGLGRGVSTLVIEYPDGETIPMPGTIYSSIGLSGVLTANYVVEPGALEADGSTARWGDANIEISTDHKAQSFDFDGTIESLAVSDAGDTLQLGRTTFSGVQRPSRFGLSVGDFEITADSVAVEEAGIETYRLGPVAFSGTSDVDGERVDGDVRMSIDALAVPGYGEADFDVAIRFTGLDGAALGQMVRTIDDAGDDAGPQELQMLLQDDLEKLVAAGFELHVDRFDFDMPQGPVALKMRFTVDDAGTGAVDLSSLLMALDAEAELTASAGFVDHAMAMNPDAGAIVGMGYLRKTGDVYEMRAEYAKGLLTINGAPMPIPLGGQPPATN